MNTTLAYRVVTPSSAVLSFLRTQIRTAFDPRVAARCCQLGPQRCGYASSRKIYQGLGPMQRERENHDLVRVEGLGNQGFAPRRDGFEQRAPQSITSCSQQSALTPYVSMRRQSSFRSTVRTFSTTSRNDFWNPFRLSNYKHRLAELQQRGAPSDDTSSGQQGFNGSLGRIMRPANELKMRCTELDEHGNVTLVSGEFKKSELIAKYGLLPRDLRKIDSSLLPHILVRPSAILINLLNLRVLLKHNRVLVFDAYGTTDSKSQSVFMYDLDLKLRQKESPANNTLAYEFRALEAVLISVTMSLEKEFEGVSEPVVRVLRELEEDIDRDKLRYLLIYSKKLGTFEQKARLVRNALEELLEADDDLSAMYLTEKSEGKSREDNDHTEVEMMLESYHKVADEIVQAAENLVSSIRNTEEIIRAILDANRNSLMLLDLKFSISTLSITAGTFVAALYGMNLKNFIEENDFGFYGVSAWCTVFGFMVAVYGLTKLRKVQIMNMYGHGPNMGRREPRSDGWGLGAWGGRSIGPPGGSRMGIGREDCMHEERLNRKEMVIRERALARKLERAEANFNETTKR